MDTIADDLGADNPETRRADPGKAERLRRLLQEEIWPSIPPELLGQPPMSKSERGEILGYGPDGV
jgi:antitoxin VapB